MTKLIIQIYKTNYAKKLIPRGRHVLLLRKNIHIQWIAGSQ